MDHTGRADSRDSASRYPDRCPCVPALNTRGVWLRLLYARRRTRAVRLFAAR